MAREQQIPLSLVDKMLEQQEERHKAQMEWLKSQMESMNRSLLQAITYQGEELTKALDNTIDQLGEHQAKVAAMYEQALNPPELKAALAAIPSGPAMTGSLRMSEEEEDLHYQYARGQITDEQFQEALKKHNLPEVGLTFG